VLSPVLGSWWKSLAFEAERGVVLGGEILRTGELDALRMRDGVVLLGLCSTWVVFLLGDAVRLTGELLGCTGVRLAGELLGCAGVRLTGELLGCTGVRLTGELLGYAGDLTTGDTA
jgi:hypothetical protein